MSMLALVLVASGVLLLVLSALGLFLLPDALSRQHAATKAVTLSLGLLLAGVGTHMADGAWWGRIVVIVALLLLTLPVAAHMLARAAARHAYREQELRQAEDPEA